MIGMRNGVALGAMVAALTLGGCGGAADAGSKGAAADATAKTASGGGWNAHDACASLGRDRATTAGGAAVTDTKLEETSKGGNGMAIVSMCTFTYANGAKLTLLARESEEDDATPTAIENVRTGGGLLPPSDPVPGLGKAAFWSTKTRQMQVFLDDRRFVVVNFFFLPAGDDAKARSLAVAKALL